MYRTQNRRSACARAMKRPARGSRRPGGDCAAAAQSHALFSAQGASHCHLGAPCSRPVPPCFYAALLAQRSHGPRSFAVSALVQRAARRSLVRALVVGATRERTADACTCCCRVRVFFLACQAVAVSGPGSTFAASGQLLFYAQVRAASGSRQPASSLWEQSSLRKPSSPAMFASCGGIALRARRLKRLLPPQSAAVLEVFHALFGLVRSPWHVTAVQVCADASSLRRARREGEPACRLAQQPSARLFVTPSPTGGLSYRRALGGALGYSRGAVRAGAVGTSAAARRGWGGGACGGAFNHDHRLVRQRGHPLHLLLLQGESRSCTAPVIRR
jgi:Protein tyrosine phosphatase-like protein, PTPLA